MRDVIGRVAVSLAVGVCVLVLASTARHDRRIARWFGTGAQPALVFEVWVPPELASEWVASLPGAWEERLGAYAVETRALATGFHVTVVGAIESDAGAIVGALTVPAVLEMRPVVPDSETARAMYRYARERLTGEVTGEVDWWRHEDSGRDYTDYYLTGPSVVAVEAAVAEMRANDPATVPPPGLELVYELVTPRSDMEDPAPFVRTYLVGGPPVVDGDVVEDAVVIWDPVTSRPEVLVELDDGGTERFGAYTERAVGEKLAILIDGVVTSAPIVQTPIWGGRIQISMGATSPEDQQAEAEALVAAFAHQAALPAGLAARLVAVETPAAAVRWAVRAVVALAAGLLAFALATLVARRTVLAPLLAPATAPRAKALAAPLAVTLGLLGLTVALERVPLPWLADWLHEMEPGDPAQSSIVALGIAPVLTAYYLIELVALVVPSWRRRRLGTPVDRIPIDRAVAALAVVLALLQGYFIATYLQSIVLDRPALVDTLLARVTVTATLAGGVMLMAVFAAAISRAGLINGWLALFGLGAARMFADVVTAPAPPVGVDPAPLHLVTAALGAVVAVALVTRRAAAPDRRRLPIGGLAPLIVAPTVVGLLAIPYLTTLPGIEAASRWLATRSPWLDLVAATILAAIWVAPRGGRVASSFALSLSVATVALLAALTLLLPAEHQLWNYVVSGAVVAVAAVELAAGIAREVRMPDGAPLIAIHDVDRADAIVDTLRGAGIPAAAGGLLARALLRLFGPFLPIVVRVPASRLDEATTLLGRGMPDGQRLDGARP